MTLTKVKYKPKKLLGLNNQYITYPAAYCQKKCVYLTKVDVAKKDCLLQDCIHVRWITKPEEKYRGIKGVEERWWIPEWVIEREKERENGQNRENTRIGQTT